MAILIIIFTILIIFIILNGADFWLGLGKEPKNKNEQSISTCESFEFVKEGNRSAVLILHEYAGMPKTFENIGRKIFDLGLDVFIPAMPGCANSIDELRLKKNSPSSFDEWYRRALELFIDLNNRYKRVYILGASLGGSVGLKIAEVMPESPAGLITISSPVKLTGRHFRKKFSRNFMIIFSGVISLFVKEIRTGRLSTEAKKMASFHGVEGIVFPSSIHTQKIGLSGVKRNLKKVITPLFAIHATGDKTVNIDNLRLICNNVSSTILIKRIFDLSNDKHTRHHRIIEHLWLKDEISLRITQFIQSIENMEKK